MHCLKQKKLTIQYTKYCVVRRIHSWTGSQTNGCLRYPYALIYMTLLFTFIRRSSHLDLGIDLFFGFVMYLSMSSPTPRHRRCQALGGDLNLEYCPRVGEFEQQFALNAKFFHLHALINKNKIL